MAKKGNSRLEKISVSTSAAATYKVVVVKTIWNTAITDELEREALVTLRKAGVKDVETIIVPGAVEIPFAIRSHARGVGDADAYIALGCVIKGDTPHFDYVCQSVTHGISLLNNELDVPVIFGILTVNNEDQARERLGGSHGHKGGEAAFAALNMIALNETFNPPLDSGNFLANLI
jgi:6,7-dimethyl-8-ribityllumazine synthase